jgi:hypothetical protein
MEEKKAIDVGGLLEELLLAGLPVVGVDSAGRISWGEEVTGQQRAQGAQITAEHRGKPARAERRIEAGITLPPWSTRSGRRSFWGRMTKRSCCCRKWRSWKSRIENKQLPCNYDRNFLSIIQVQCS